MLSVCRLLVSFVIPSLSDVLPPRTIPTAWLRLRARSNQFSLAFEADNYECAMVSLRATESLCAHVRPMWQFVMVDQHWSVVRYFNFMRRSSFNIRCATRCWVCRSSLIVQPENIKCARERYMCKTTLGVQHFNNCWMKRCNNVSMANSWMFKCNN